MFSPRSPVGGFFLRVLIWLPVIFVIWFYMAIVMSWPVTWLTNLLLPLLLPDAISGIEQNGYMLDIITRFIPALQAGVRVPENRVAEMVFSVNPLMYGYGIPLFTALLFATPEGEEGEKWFRWLVATAILILVQAFGVSMDALKTILFGMGPEVFAQMGFGKWQLEATALGYQLGYLILPAVTPVALWIGFHKKYIEQLAPGLISRLANNGSQG